MATYEKVTASANGEREFCIDRLIKIDGIARKTAEAMYEIGVHSYADLAQYLSQRTAQQVSAALKEHGVKRSPAFIDPVRWARQAKEFGELENTAPTPPEEEREPAEKPEETPSSHDLREHDSVFMVSFDVERVLRTLYQIGIRSYTDLVQYWSQRTAQQVSAALREHGVNRPPAFIDPAEWARQAREFGELENTAPTSPGDEAEPATEPEEAPSSRDSWIHDTVFTVSFDVAEDGDREPVLRTTVCDRTNGGLEEVFDGSDTVPWVNWILERAHLPVAAKRIAAQDEAVASPVPVEPGDARLEIGDVQLSVIEPTTDDSENRLKAEVSFQLSGTGAETLASKSIPFRIEGYTVDVESGVSELVASEQSQLEPQVFEYVGQQEFDIPDVGHYEFHSIVLLLPPGNMATYYCGPTIRVAP